MSKKEVLETFPDLLALLDATNWRELQSENFLLNRLSYSSYKHFVAFQVLLGKYISVKSDWLCLIAFFSRFDDATHSLALSYLRWHFQRDKCDSGPIYTKTGSYWYALLIRKLTYFL